MPPKYVKKDPISHILDRPDMYVGSTRPRDMEDYVVLDKDYHIGMKTVKVAPALLRIFIEPLSNVIDNVARSKISGKKVTKVKISIDPESGETTFWNDGEVIPVEIHPEEKCYNHTLVFGHLLTSSNYDDKVDRQDISGRNGLGIKAVCVFSKKFTVEGADPVNKKILTQTWTNNMRNTEEPAVKSTTLKTGYTYISYVPDFSQFHITGYTPSIISLFKRYAVDMAMLTKVPVYFNEELIPVESIQDYANLFVAEEPEQLYMKTPTCEVVLRTSDEFRCVSFANGVYTPLGGTHVDAWSEHIFRPILEKLNKPKKPQLSITDVKKYFQLFIVASVKNPEYDSQSKLKLEAPAVEAMVKISQIKTILKWKVIEKLEDMIHAKELVSMKKNERKKRGHQKVDNLDPANNEGNPECTLILVEGLSAKTYAVQGIERGVFGKKGRDWNGIMALRGKVLNTRNSNLDTVSKNKVVSNIIKALGIKYGVDYTNDENYNTLRYGRLLSITDADSVTGDTPLLLRDAQGNITIKAIDSLNNQWMVAENGKEYTEANYSVWTEKGWTLIKGVMRHKVNKRMFRVATPTGVVDVTEDHSLLDESGKELSPKEVKMGTKLMCSFPETEGTIQTITLHEAMLMGRLWGEKMRSVMSQIYQFPEVVLNSSREVREKFYSGVYGKEPEDNHKIYNVEGKIGTQWLFYLAKSIGYNVSVQCNHQGVFSLTMTKGEIQGKNEVRELIELEHTEQYVYDLETENHHFQAGVGELIVHNTDGIHICSLLQNMFHSLFPSILQRSQPFFTSMQTPIVRVYLNKGDRLFYDEREYHRYVQEMGNKKINKKYYKGLGASTEQDIKESFGQKIVEFKLDEHTTDTMNKVFHTKHADQRKQWLENYNPDNIVLRWNGNEKECQTVCFSDYLNTELIKFSIDDCKRSIPSLIDGLKEGHRKVLYVCLLRNLKYTGKTIKVAQLAGSVAEKSGYHHGEQNLYNTITNMANDYVGSNNVPLLFRDGQFGSRLFGGDDAANGRYIYTKLDALTRLLFREEDDVLLTHIEDDGEKVEPTFYVPILPTILINGSSGIGTGWSCNVPCYNPLDLVGCVKSWLETRKTNAPLCMELTPWYRGFTGEIEKVDKHKFVSWGKVDRDKPKQVVVTELPVNMWTNDFKDSLEDMWENKQISGYKNHSTPHTVSFTIKESSDMKCDKNTLKLHSYLHTSNIVLFTEEGKLKKYDSIHDIIDEYCQVRMRFYVKRKKYQLDNLDSQIKFLGNKRRFLEEIRDGKISLFETVDKKRQSRPVKDLIKELVEKGYDKETEEGEEEEEEEGTKGYNYLLRLQFRSITAEKITQLKNDISTLQEKRDGLASTTEERLWLNDLNEFEEAYKGWLKTPKKKSKE